MIPRIDDYKRIVGADSIRALREKAEKVEGRHITNINSVYAGGGVAEILNSLVLLMNDLNVNVGWRIMKGTHSFFDVTKSFHNALQGEPVDLTQQMKDTYAEETLRNAKMTHFSHHDMIIVHDPQPLALIDHMPKKQPWIWRCHIDISTPHVTSWTFLEQFVRKYDGMILSMNEYSPGLGMPEHIIHPSIDPISDKNKDLNEKEAITLLAENGIDPDKPIMTQISRFDKWKDPIGVLKIFEKVRKEKECQLVLMGDMAADDPEGQRIYVDVVNKAKGREDIIIITKRDDLLVNALQKMSSVVLQNSVKEGFGLTVSEALWKRTPVIARPSGGIPLQVIDGETGYLVNNEDEAAGRILEVMGNDDLRRELGENGREHVKKNFLITRHMMDYLDVYDNYINKKN